MINSRKSSTSSLTLAVLIFLLTNSMEGRKAGRARLVDLVKTGLEQKALRKDSGEKSCMILASCHLAMDDIYRARGVFVSDQYKKASRDSIFKHERWIACGVDRILEKCAIATLTCWARLKELAINGRDELTFVNRCGGETLPYMYNLCIGNTKGQWPEDIEQKMSSYYPEHCTLACSAFRQFNRFHKRNNVSVFPPGWTEGMNVGLDDRDGMDWTNGMVMQARSLGLIPDQSTQLPAPAITTTTTTPKPMDPNYLCNFFTNCTNPTKTTAQTNAEEDHEDDLNTQRLRRLKREGQNCGGNPDCLKNLFQIPPSFPPIEVHSMNNEGLKNVVIQTRVSACRGDSWVGAIYADFPNSFFGLCYDGGRDYTGSHVSFSTSFVGTPNAQNWKNCDQGVNGIPSYIMGGVLHLNSTAGWIETAEWICSGAENVVDVSDDKTNTLRCPNEMLICAITAYVMKIGNDYKIMNLKLGCCDVPSPMLYSATTFNTLPIWEQHEVGGIDQNSLLQTPSKIPERRLCPANTFITQMEVTLQTHEGYKMQFRSTKVPLLKLNFKCSDYRAMSTKSKTISNGLYTLGGAKVNGRANVECPVGYYAFGMAIGAKIVNENQERSHLRVNSAKLLCSNNTDDTATEFGVEFDMDEDLGGQFYVVHNVIVKCALKEALCGFLVTPGNKDDSSKRYTHISGYQYEFICCPIPVRNIVEQECKATGVQLVFEEDTQRKSKCSDVQSCFEEAGDGVIEEIVPSTYNLTGHYPAYIEELRKSILTATNIRMGVNFSLHIGINNFSTYLGAGLLYDILDENNTKTVEGRQTSLNFVNPSAIALATTSLVFALVPGGAMTSGYILSGSGFLALASNIIGQNEPDKLDNILDRLMSLQNEIKVSKLYTQVLQKRVSLKFPKGPNDFIRVLQGKAIFYRYVAQCGRGKYDLGYDEMYDYVTSTKCDSAPVDRFQQINVRRTQLFTKSTTNKTISLRFNRVGAGISSEKENNFAHRIKWEKVIEGLAEDSFGTSAQGIGGFYGNQTFLFQRPNITKFYFAEFVVPAGMVGEVYQLVVECGPWSLYTKTLRVKFSDRIETFERQPFALGPFDAHE